MRRTDRARHGVENRGSTISGRLPAAVVAAALLALACGGGGPSAEEVAQGQTQFRKTCATCHGQNAEGMPRLGKDLHNNAFVQSKSEAELIQFLKEGRPATHPDNTRGVDMPPKGGNPAITDEELRLIVGYLRSIQ